MTLKGHLRMPLDTKYPSTCKQYLEHVQNGLYAFVVSTHTPVVEARLPHVKQRIFSASLKGTTPTANSGKKKKKQLTAQIWKGNNDENSRNFHKGLLMYTCTCLKINLLLICLFHQIEIAR